MRLNLIMEYNGSYTPKSTLSSRCRVSSPEIFSTPVAAVRDRRYRESCARDGVTATDA
jgi:hypothetical protein